MKTHLFLLLALAVTAVSAVGQQRDQSTFDHFNRFNLNNARAGLDSCIHAFAQHKQQWVGVKGAPDNTQLQAHMPIGADMGVGLEVANWRAGLLSATNIAGTFAKHFDIGSKYRISGALSLGYYQYSFGADDAVVFDRDNYLDQSRATSGGVYGDLGVLFTGEQFEVGLSVPSLFSTAPSFDIGSEVNEYNVEPYLNAHASYAYDLNSDFQLSPMVIYRSIPGNGSVMDFKAGMRYRNMLGVNLGYRTRNGLIAAVDYTFMDRYKIGYAYDAGLTQLNGISNGSHEFLLGFQLCKAKRQKQPKEPEVVDYYLSGTVRDDKTQQPMPDFNVVLKNTTTGTSKTIQTDSTGTYLVKVDSSASYEVSAASPDYERTAKTLNVNPASTSTTQNLDITHKQVSAQGQVRDAKTGQPLEGVVVTLSRGEEVNTAMTDETGRFTLPLKDKKRGDQLNYSLQLRRDGYEPSSSSVQHTMNNYDPIQLNKAVEGGLTLAPKPEPKPEQISEIIDLEPIRFEVNSAKLTPASTVELDKVVKVLTDNPDMQIEVGAHTDCTGNADGNQRLSEKRAQSSMEYIQSRIENPERVTGQGYGESRPLTTCECGDCTKADHELNRRTEFRIVE